MLSIAAGADRAGADLFSETRIVRLSIEIPEPAVARLRESPRTHVRAVVRESTNVLANVALRLKGRTGSFRGIDDKPSFTLECDRFVPDQRLRGLSQLHLNNSVEDPSFLHEWLGAEMFRSAGVPAPRVTHAWVELNGRRLGLYVLKESFSRDFLAQYFPSSDGNLYEPEPGEGADVTGPMRRDLGSGVSDRSDLRRLVVAAAQTNLTDRWSQLGGALDTNRFLSFLALEVLLGHRDGYALARNNYRLYHEPSSDRFVFLPGGMDNLLGRAAAGLHPHMVGTVAKALMEIPEGRQAYRHRLGTLFANQFRVDALTNAVRRRADELARELPRAEARALRREAEDLEARIARRASEVARQLAEPAPAPLEFTGDVGIPDGWRAQGAPTDGIMDHVNVAGISTLHVRAETRSSASWRTQVWLKPGRYRFEGKVRARDVKALVGARSSGVSLSVSGQRAEGNVPLTGDHEWTTLRAEFVLTQEIESLELQCLLRAESGEAWFDRNSLRLVRVDAGDDRQP